VVGAELFGGGLKLSRFNRRVCKEKAQRTQSGFFSLNRVKD